MKTELKTLLTWERKQGSQRVPNKINPRRTTPRHTVTKIKRLKAKREIKSNKRKATSHK